MQEQALAPWQAMQPTPVTLAGQQRLAVRLPPKAPLQVPMLIQVLMLLQVPTTSPTRKAKVVLLRVAVTGRT